LKRAGKRPRERPDQKLTRIEREGIKEIERSFGGTVEFQVEKTSQVKNF